MHKIDLKTKTKPKTAQLSDIEEMVRISLNNLIVLLFIFSPIFTSNIYLTIEYKYTKGYKNIQISYCLKLKNPLVEEKIGLSFEDRGLIDITDSGVADVVPLARGSLTWHRLRRAANLHTKYTFRLSRPSNYLAMTG